jgi:hypothetical protein
MYDLLDMNNYLISILPDIGVSIRRYINKCEKQKNTDEQEDEFDLDLESANYEEASFLSENSNDEDEQQTQQGQSNEKENTDETLDTQQKQYNHKEPPRSFESFSKGLFPINFYFCVEYWFTNESIVDKALIR